jgi:hypothetical protein
MAHVYRKSELCCEVGDSPTVSDPPPQASLDIERIDWRTATAFFQKYEHLGNCGLGVWHWGAIADGHLIGVVSFGTTCFARSRGSLSNVANQFGLAVYQVCRGGTRPRAPRNTPSRILCHAMRELRRERGDCLIVAYADSVYKEVGTIYQACNGLYMGQTNPKDQSNYIIKRRLLSGWLVRKKYGTRAMDKLKKVDARVIKIPLTKKYRYVFIQATPLAKARVLRILRPFALPYPKRASENIEPMRVADLVDHRVAIYASSACKANELRPKSRDRNSPRREMSERMSQPTQSRQNRGGFS